MSAAAEVDPEEIADLTLRLIAEESPSGQEGRVAGIVREELERRGFAVEVDELGNVVGTIDAGPGPCVLFDSHMDTVGVTDPSQWTHSPSGELADGRVYGRGAMDMKGPLAASIAGASAAAGALRAGRVAVCASVLEEVAEGKALVQVAERARPDFVVICEATSLRVASAQRGRAEVILDVEGQTTHSSRPDLGVNAAEAMADAIRACREVARPRHETLGEGILVLTDVISRPYPGLSVVPDRCLATFDRRTLPGESQEDVLAPLRELAEATAAEHGARASVRLAEDELTAYTGVSLAATKFAPAWDMGTEAPIVRAVLRGLAAAELPAETGHYAFCTNGSGSAGTLGIPTVGFGPGDEALAHRVDEHITVGQLSDGARGYAAIAAALTEPAA